MSLIIAYVGKKGCVMAADKRRIAYFGENRESLEAELYDGTIKTDNELIKRAEELDVPIKISDDASKLNAVGNTIRGEVSEKGTYETKRRRIYGTTNGYQLVELVGSEVISRQAGEKAIVLFGNKFAKNEAQGLINKKWKSSQSLKYMGDIFEEVLRDVSRKTPTVGSKFDVMIIQPKFDKSEAQKHLNMTIDNDVKLLFKYRQQLTEDLYLQKKEIELADKIINDGKIGKISQIDGEMILVKLNNDVQAFDFKWKQVAKPGENVLMIANGAEVELGDEIVIEDETLCLKKDKSPLSCKIILCSF